MQKKSISNNYLSIQGWMTEQLGLKGNELITYALIHGFSQDGESEFNGSIAYIQQWLGCARQTVFNTLQSLEKKGLIKKHEINTGGYKLCSYRTTVQKSDPQSKNHTPPVQNLDKTSPEIRPNNIYNIKDNITTPSFDHLWQLYGQKGNYIKSKAKYSELTPDEKNQIWQHLTGDNHHIGYLDATSHQNHKYRKNLENYITSREFEKPLNEQEIMNLELV